ncbi:MAG: ubiquinone biosynthesis accessory factor UbiJ [Vibrio sp.]
MPLAPLLTALLETTLNRLISEDPGLIRQRQRLKGKAISLHLREWQQTVTFVFSQQIDVMTGFEGQADCYLALDLSILRQLREQENITQLIKQDKLQLEGDLQLAQKFAALISDCRPDIEEWLSRMIGDVLAHSLVHGVKNLADSLQQQMSQSQHHLAQVLTEEWRVAPPALEIAHFCDQVDELTSHTARLEARISQLLGSA